MKKYIILLLILLGVYWFINHRADQPITMTATDAAQVIPEDIEKEDVIFPSSDEEDIEDVTPPLILNGALDEDVQDSDLGIEVTLDDQGLEGQDDQLVVVEPEYE